MDSHLKEQKASQLLYCWDLGNSSSIYASCNDAGITPRLIGSPAEAAQQLSCATPSVILVHFPARYDEKLVRQLGQLIDTHSHCAWVALLEHDWQHQETLSRLIAHAFFDYLHMPVESSRLQTIIGHAFGMLQLRQQFAGRQGSANIHAEILGESSAMQQLKRNIDKLSQTQSSTLIHGETGTGKELIARAIHRNSPRADGAFEAINCAALPATLIQAELFGFEKGAFTGAHQRKIGRFEACNGGTLFLDEIGDMPLEQQVNLLRVLEQGCLRRVGGNCDLPIDVRIITATHIDLEKAVASGQFREDLYYRLNVLKLTVPPLRERNGDIELLARHFFQQYRSSNPSAPRGFSHEALETMQHYNWPGNVRELINRVQQAAIMAEGQLILPSDLGIDRRESKRRYVTLEQARKQAELHAINDALHRHPKNISEAARELGVSRVTLYRLMDKLGIRRPCP